MIAPPAVPLVCCLATTALCMLTESRPIWQRGISGIGSIALLLASIALLQATRGQSVIAFQAGAWEAPFGITLMVDPLAAMGLCASSFIFSVAALRPTDASQLGQRPAFHALTLGVSGAFLAGDLFNLYVWFEVMLISSFVLLTLDGGRAETAAGLKYVVMNLAGSFFFLVGLGLLYGVAGTLNMADLAIRLPEVARPGVVGVFMMLFVAAFVLKAGLFPLAFWLPASYGAPPAAVASAFAGILTKIGIFALIRLSTLFFASERVMLLPLLSGIGVLSVIAGSFMAFGQTAWRRALSFLLISHVGTLAIGVGLGSPAALRGTCLYLVHEMLVMAALFWYPRDSKRPTGRAEIGLRLIALLALVGVPPFSGFFGKIGLLQAAMELGDGLAAGVMLFGSFATLVVGVRLWQSELDRPRDPDSIRRTAPLAALVLAGLLYSAFIGPLTMLADQAAQTLTDPQRYTRAAGLEER